MTDTEDASGSSEAESTVCANGHMLTATQRFCPECGQAAAVPDRALPAGLSQTGKAPTNGKHVRTIIICTVIAALIAVGVVVALSLHHSSESISYRDGYSAGKQMAQQQISAAASNPAANACDVSATLPSYNGGPPSGDNTSQWTSGCIAGYNASNYDANHPGATNNSGNSGNSGN
jgi:hypothetical protein